MKLLTILTAALLLGANLASVQALPQGTTPIPGSGSVTTMPQPQPTPLPTPPLPSYEQVSIQATGSNYLAFDSTDAHSNGRKGVLRFGAPYLHGPSTCVLVKFADVSALGGAVYSEKKQSITFTIEGAVPVHVKATGETIPLEVPNFDWDLDSTTATLLKNLSVTVVGHVKVKVVYDPLKKLTYVTLKGEDIGKLFKRWVTGYYSRNQIPNRGIFLTLDSLGLDDGEIIAFGAFSKHPPVFNAKVEKYRFE